MKLRILAILVFLAVLTGCSTSKTAGPDNFIEESTESAFIDSKPESDLSVLDVMDYMTSAYSEYNTFVFIDNTVHIMNCVDSVNRTAAELAREISSITNSSYEMVSIQTVEYTTELLYRRIRVDYINIEDSDDIRNQSTNDIVAFYQQDDEHLKRLYDQYEVIIRQSIPGVTDYIGKEEATITELMGQTEQNAFAGFAILSTNDNKQVFIFPNSYLGCKFNEDALTIQTWEAKQEIEPTLSEAIVETSPDTEEALIVEAFLQEMLYGNSNSEGEEYLYNTFMYYELFHGPQTEEQMRGVLENYKNLVRETVYDVFAKSYDHSILEAAIQNAHSEIESWWDKYLCQPTE